MLKSGTANPYQPARPRRARLGPLGLRAVARDAGPGPERRVISALSYIPDHLEMHMVTPGLQTKYYRSQHARQPHRRPPTQVPTPPAEALIRPCPHPRPRVTAHASDSQYVTCERIISRAITMSFASVGFDGCVQKWCEAPLTSSVGSCSVCPGGRMESPDHGSTSPFT